MLLRPGIVYSGGAAWTKIQDSWLRGQRFDQQSRQLAYDSAYEAMVLTVDRRDRLDRAIREMTANSSYTPGGAPARLPVRHLHTDRFRVGG
jgi:transposase